MLRYRLSLITPEDDRYIELDSNEHNQVGSNLLQFLVAYHPI